MTIFKPCDIRGIVGRQWGADDARRIGLALGTLMRRRDEHTVYVGGDHRNSTPELKRALVQGLLSSGTDVCDLGRVPTPVVYFAARNAGCGNAAIVTASHNPAPYNGVKFMVAHQPAIPELVAELQRFVSTGVATARAGQVEHQSALSCYESWLARELNLDESTGTYGRPRRVVLDTMHGALGGIAARVLKQHGFQVTTLRDDVAADFRGITPNPAHDVNLHALVERVTRTGAHVGIATDGDGDRVIFVDHRGRIVRPEQIAVLLVRERYGACTLVYDLKCASIVARAVAAADGHALMQPSGHGFIKTAMIRHRATLGVEVSGHHFYSCLGGGDDGLFTALLVLRLLQENDRSLAELCDSAEWPAVSPDVRIPFEGDTHDVLRCIASACGGRVSRIDGVRAEYGDGEWALARGSITEPAMTFRFEGCDLPRMRAVANRFLAAVPEFQRQVMEVLDD